MECFNLHTFVYLSIPFFARKLYISIKWIIKKILLQIRFLLKYALYSTQKSKKCDNKKIFIFTYLTAFSSPMVALLQREFPSKHISNHEEAIRS